MASERLNLNFTASETVSKALEKIEQSTESASRSASELGRTFLESTGTSEAFEQGIESAARAVDKVDDNAAQASRSVSTLSATQASSSGSAATAAAAQHTVANAIDRAGDEAREAAVEMSVMDAVMKNLSISAGGLSFNMGAFTIALRNVGTQIPLLVTSIGSLVAILGSLITVATGATVALGGLLTGGIIARAQELEESLSGVENQAEALQLIMSGMRDLFISALDPLIVEENIDAFESFVNFVAGVVNRFAQATEQMRSMFLGFATDIASHIDASLDDIFSSFQLLSEEVGPVLVDLIDFFIDHLPGAMDFFRRVTMELIGPISDFADQFRELIVELVDFAAAAGQGILPVLTGLVRAFTNLVATLNEFSSTFTGSIAAVAVGAVILGKMVSTTNDVIGVLIPLAGTFNKVFLEASSARGALAGVNAQLQGLFAQRLGNLANLGTLLKLTAIEGLTMSDAFERIQKSADDAAEDIDDVNEELSETSRKIARLQALGAGDEFFPVDFDRKSVEVSDFRDNMEDTSEAVDTFVGESARKMQDIDLGPMTGGGTIGEFVDFDEFATTPEKFDPSEFPEISKRRRLGNRDAARLPVPVDAFPDIQTGGRRGAFTFGDDVTAGDEVSESITPNLDKVTNKLNAVKDSSNSLASALKTTVVGAVTGAGQAFVNFSNKVASGMMWVAGGVKTAILATWEYITTLWASVTAQFTSAAASGGLAAGLRAVASNAWGAVAGLAATAAGAIASAAGFVLATVKAISFGTVLNVALAGIPALLGAIVVGAGLIVGVLGNMDNAGGSLKATFSVVRSVLEGLFDAIVTLGVPAWNLMLNVVELFLNTVMFIPNLLTAILRHFGLVNEDATTLSLIMDGLTTAFSVFGDILGWVIDQIAFVLKGISGLIDAVNKFISFGGGDQLSGLQTTEADVRSNVSGAGDEADKENFATKPNPNLNITNETNNNVKEINARPEDKQRIKNLVKDAMDEANTFRRQKDAFSG